MIDTLNLWLDKAVTGTANPFHVAAILSNVTERQNERMGYSCTGTIGDYTVTIYESGISLNGSLAKHYLPSNIYTLTRATVKEALEMLSDQLNIDVAAAIIRRVDISTVIPTHRPPADYFSRLGSKPHFKRLQAAAETLYYNTQKKQLIFYDKTKEARAKGVEIPPALAGCNLFRYELRFLHRLQQQFKQPEPPTAAILYNQDFYYWLVGAWRAEFQTIQKIKSFTTMTEQVRTPREAANVLFSQLLQGAGGQSAVSVFLADLKAKNAFADPKAYTRLKNNLNAILSKPTAANAQDELIAEIERAINDIAKYAR